MWAPPAPSAAITEGSTLTLGLVAAIAIAGAGFISSWSQMRAKLHEAEKSIEALERQVIDLLGWRERRRGEARARRDTGPRHVSPDSDSSLILD